MNHYIEDFTEGEYRRLLQVARRSWEFIPYTRCREKGRLCLWRHDVDFSMHRAYRLAQIEADEGVLATYFIHLHSNFYHPLEPAVAELVSRIRELGHELGVHFDPGFYASLAGEGEDVFAFLPLEQQLIERTFGTKVHVFSMHNPDAGRWMEVTQDEVCGMVNTYGEHLRKHFRYVSDSNGYWRFDRLFDVLDAGTDEQLQVLTHPEWWTPDVMTPRARITRCIEGRAARQHTEYDDLLERLGRLNVR